MLALSLSQRFAVIGTMPSRALRHADTALFDAIANALAQMPAVSLTASVERAFASQGHPISTVEAAPIARAIAAAEDAGAPLLGAIVARACAPPRAVALA